MIQNTFIAFLGWSFLWTIVLILPPGSKEIATAYRFNFLHGVICCSIATLCLNGFVPHNVASMCTVSYFIVDFANILLNDFYFKVPSYQNAQNRRVEYAHHIFCCFVGLMCEAYFKDFCTFENNPFVQLMYSEFSTPFLMAWRYSKHDFFGFLFVVSFVLCRLVYHGLYFVPECISRCHPSVGYGFGVPYNIMNASSWDCRELEWWSIGTEWTMKEYLLVGDFGLGLVLESMDWDLVRGFALGLIKNRLELCGRQESRSVETEWVADGY
eukprot:gene3060-5994_t